MCGEKYRLALFHETIDGVKLEAPLYIEYILAGPEGSEERAYALDMMFDKLLSEAKRCTDNYKKEFKKEEMQ